MLKTMTSGNQSSVLVNKINFSCHLLEALCNHNLQVKWKEKPTKCSTSRFIIGKRPKVVKSKADELEKDDRSSMDIDKPAKKLKLVVYGDSDSDND